LKKKNWIVVALCIAIVGMGIGFAALAQNLQINATANITGEWDVRIMNIHDSGDWGGEGSSTVGTPSFDGTSATFEVDLEYPGAWREYIINVQNFGNIDAILDSITGISAANSAAPSEIQISARVSSPSLGMTPFTTTDTTVGYTLFPGITVDIHAIFVRVEWVIPPDGVESVIPDVKSKAATINLNYVQNT